MIRQLLHFGLLIFSFSQLATIALANAVDSSQGDANGRLVPSVFNADTPWLHLDHQDILPSLSQNAGPSGHMKANHVSNPNPLQIRPIPGLVGHKYCPTDTHQRLTIFFTKRDCNGKCAAPFTIHFVINTQVIPVEISNCKEPLQLCVDKNATYDIIDPTTGVSFPDAIVKGSPQQDIFDFTLEDCCFAAAPNAGYQVISGNQTISGSQVWRGKIYLTNGTIVTVNGGSLDLTQVDIVFGKCAGIDFTNGASLRANDAVFRSCDPLESWRGFRFSENSKGLINECTFKNAQMALDLSGTWFPFSTATVRITNNLFANNRIAIYLEQTSISDAISGNTFMIDDQNIHFEQPSCSLNLPFNNNYWGIYAVLGRFNHLISQNDFIDTSKGPSQKDFTGVLLSFCDGATLTDNRFTDADHALDVLYTCRTRFDNNQIEKTFSSLGDQVVLDRSSQITIDNNQFQNFDGASIAISILNSEMISVTGNQISQFGSGINLRNSSTSEIIENTIKESKTSAINLWSARDLEIHCNRIIGGRPEIGIYYQQNNAGNNHINIWSNCIFNSTFAILLDGNYNKTVLPSLRNNYLFNYQVVGIANFGFTGNIGSSLSPYQNSGHNTFVSNNIPNFSYDIWSNTNLIAYGNFGIATVSANVTVVGNGLYNSTTACGNQIGTVSSQLIPQELCFKDRFFVKFFEGAPGNRRLPEKALQHLETLSRNDRFRLTVSLFGVLAENKDPAEGSRLLKLSLDNEAFSSEQKQWLGFLSEYTRSHLVSPILIKRLSQTDKKETEISLETGNPSFDALISAKLSNPPKGKQGQYFRVLCQWIAFQNEMYGPAEAYSPFPKLPPLQKFMEETKPDGAIQKRP